MVHPKLRTAGRWLSPTTFVLAGLCFALPFVTVSCSTPGGYGRADVGGTTTYTGIDLAVGGRPDVSPPEKILPVTRQREDRLPPQPTAVVVLVLVATGTGVAIAIGDPRTRRGTVAMIGGLAASALLVNQALVESEVTLRVGEQLSISSPGTDPHQFVRTGVGFAACLLLLVAAIVVNAIAWWRGRPRPAIVAPAVVEP